MSVRGGPDRPVRLCHQWKIACRWTPVIAEVVTPRKFTSRLAGQAAEEWPRVLQLDKSMLMSYLIVFDPLMG